MDIRPFLHAWKILQLHPIPQENIIALEAVIERLRDSLNSLIKNIFVESDYYFFGFVGLEVASIRFDQIKLGPVDSELFLRKFTL